MYRATFVLSTGRCGTQWLAHGLRAALGSTWRVEHEPLHHHYAARRMLGAGDPSMLEDPSAKRIAQHVEEIERTLETRNYFEAGHPCWSSLPWLARRLASRVRVVHLVRHPVPTACSWVSHGAFAPPLLPHLPVKELIAPTDAGVNFPEYRATWSKLSAYEKSLVYWAEVNAFGLRLERSGSIPWLRLRYEELFASASESLVRLAQFLEVPAVQLRAVDPGERVDRYHFQLQQWPELERVAAHPQIIAVAAALGYHAENFERDRLRARFAAAGPIAACLR